MPQPAPILDEAGRQRWSETFHQRLHTARHHTLAELARYLQVAVSLKEVTLRSELTRLCDGDHATLGRWLARPERWEALAQALDCSSAALDDDLASAARPVDADAWEALFPDGDVPPPLPVRLREGHLDDALETGERGATRTLEAWIVKIQGWLTRVGGTPEEKLQVALAAWPGGGVDVAMTSLAQALVRAGLNERAQVERVTPDDTPNGGGSPGRLVLTLLPWAQEELRAIASLLEARGVPRAVTRQIQALAAEVERAPLAHESLMTPRRVLTWARDRRLRPGTPSSIAQLLGEQALAACAERGKGHLHNRLGLGFLCQLFAAWRLAAPAGDSWPVLKPSEVESFIKTAGERAHPGRPGSEEIDGLLSQLETAPAEKRGVLIAELRGALDLDPAQLFERLVRGGVITQPRPRKASPADPALAEALAAKALVADGQLDQVLHPRFVTLLDRMVAEGLSVSDLLDAVDRAPPHRLHLACQAAACALATCTLPDDETLRARAVRIWAGAVYSWARGTGFSHHPGYLMLAPAPEDMRVVRRLQALSERGRDWLPELGASGLHTILEPLVPPAVRTLAEIWDEGRDPLRPDELDQPIATVAPWQLDVFAPEVGAVLDELRPWTNVSRILDWRLERGDTRALRLAVGLEELGEEPGLLRLRWLNAFLGGWSCLRLAARVPANEAELHRLLDELTPGLFRREGLDDAARVELLAPLLGRLPFEDVERWVREALLYAIAGPNLMDPAFNRDGTPKLSPDNPLWRALRGQSTRQRAVSVLLGVAERLPLRALLIALTNAPMKTLGDPSRWPTALGWPRATKPKWLEFALREPTMEALSPLEHMDSLAKHAAEALFRIGDPEPLRRRWREPLLLPEQLITQAAQRALIALASAAGHDVLSRTPPPEGSEQGDPRSSSIELPFGRSEYSLWNVAGRDIDAKKVPADAQAAIRCMHALTARAERECLVLDRPLLDWLAQLVLEHVAPDYPQDSRLDALGLLGWPVDLNRERAYVDHQEAPWSLTRQTEAAKLLRLALDVELIRCGNQLLLERHTANTKARQLAQDLITRRYSEDAALAERAWELASPEERRALPLPVLEGELAPQIDTVRWAQRAAAMGLELAGRSLVYRLSGQAALAIGQPWIICAGSPLEQLRRALQVHARAPWPEPLAPLLRRWLLDEACPFGAPDVPFEEDWDRVADAALDAVRLAVETGEPLSQAELRQGVARLWTIAIALPASVRERISFLPRWDSPPVSTLVDLLMRLEHFEPLKQTFLHPPATQEGDERWWTVKQDPGERDETDRPAAARALLARLVIPRLDPRALRALTVGPHAERALQELLRRGDRKTLARCEALIAASPRLSHEAKMDKVAPDFPVRWISALIALCEHQPGLVIELYRRWLQDKPESRPELLRALAGWAAPPAPVPGVEDLLNEELRRLMSHTDPV
jgi:hypothetical protein